MSGETTGDWTAWPGERFALGEGLRLIGDRLIMVDILTGRLLELPEHGEPRVLLQLDEPLGAVSPLPGGGWLAAAGTGIAVLGDSGVQRWLARPEDGAATPMRMNDAVADPHGRFWAGSMAYDNTPGAGSLYRVDPDGTVTRALGGLTVPNGPAFDAEGTTMYLADSARGVIHRFAVDPASGQLGERTEFATVEHGSPDGMTVDADGHLWSAIWGAGRVHRYSPDGELARVVEVPATQPTSVCVLGERLVLTSATVGLGSPGEFDGAVLTTTL
ncbi:SMP-30/gluconolactonase/LRE family protein [Prauserella cavernicola]|uniref:SMP-30/gluconolactonase/LRE family protein n=1 Tax=Prauserella cavernicola TaxID=2800127 RepID=A0A934QML9_9PSEU|nr:SMP-30/gluconolactonase/LRE family protein [Prauserella cavernicola]MBK1783140.1 SMP-30/gluconolactonase/LRE family protein [Prauserella cavernicola]